MIDLVPEISDEELDEIFRQLDANENRSRLRRANPWTRDIIRVLWGGWLTMDKLTRTLWEMRNPVGLPIPKAFKQTVQSTLNHHTSQSRLWKGNPTDDLFYSPEGKGSGTWAVHRDRAATWLRAKKLPSA